MVCLRLPSMCRDVGCFGHGTVGTVCITKVFGKMKMKYVDTWEFVRWS